MHFYCIDNQFKFTEKMTFNTNIPKHLKKAFYLELDNYFSSLKIQNHSDAWYHLERCHIIGQSYPYEHTYTHWLMLKFGFRQKDLNEVLGQVLRLVFGGWKSFIDRVPIGNTGGSNVPPLKSMPITNDLNNFFK